MMRVETHTCIHDNEQGRQPVLNVLCTRPFSQSFLCKKISANALARELANVCAS
jgi:hypothetical protein